MVNLFNSNPAAQAITAEEKAAEARLHATIDNLNSKRSKSLDIHHVPCGPDLWISSEIAQLIDIDDKERAAMLRS